jgi:prepilin-type N-terminal cleavage/methylation domain-containing protein
MRRLATLHHRGMTLLEVVIAVAIAGVVSLGLYGSAIYTMRQTAKNVEHIFAVQLANSSAAKVRAARFEKLAAEPSTLEANEFEKQFSETQTVQLDPLNPNSTEFTLSYKMTGFGAGVEVSGNGNGSAKLTLPSHSEEWKKDQFAGHFLVITGGKGANQLRRIKNHQKSNQASGKKTVTATLVKNMKDSEPEETGWVETPGSSSVFAVDYGLYCDIQVTWGDGAGYKTVKETVYVPN